RGLTDEHPAGDLFRRAAGGAVVLGLRTAELAEHLTLLDRQRWCLVRRRRRRHGVAHVAHDPEAGVAAAQLVADSQRLLRVEALPVDPGAVGAVEVGHEPAPGDELQLGVVARDGTVPLEDQVVALLAADGLAVPLQRVDGPTLRTYVVEHRHGLAPPLDGRDAILPFKPRE